MAALHTDTCSKTLHVCTHVHVHCMWVESVIGMNKLCQHNLGNNRQPIAFENYAGIIGSSVGLLSAHAHDLCGYAPVYTFFSPQNMPMT